MVWQQLVVAATLLGSCSAFLAPASLSGRAHRLTTPSMALDAELTKTYPRDFKNIPMGTNYGESVLHYGLRLV